MKRLLCLVGFFAVAVCVSAGSKFKLKSGDLSVFGKDAKAEIVFDYGKAEIENKDLTLEEYIERKGSKSEQRWELAQERALKDFVKRFNKRSPGLQLTTKGSAAYKVVVEVRTIGMGSTLRAFLPVGMKKDGGTTLFGRVYVKDKSGKEVCQLRFADVQGLGAGGIEARLLFAYQELCYTWLKFLKKSVDQVVGDGDDDDETDFNDGEGDNAAGAADDDDDD